MNNDKLVEALRDARFVVQMMTAICETDTSIDREKAKEASRRVELFLQAHPAESAQADLDALRGLSERWKHRAKVAVGDRQDALLDCADELAAVIKGGTQ